jgi:hypothetical protein
MRKLFALALIASMPLAGVAQSLAPAQQNPLAPATSPSPQLLEQMLGSSNLLDGNDARAVPLWGTPDGRILTLVTAGGDLNLTLPKSPQVGALNEWRLIDVTNLVSGGLLMRLGNNANLHLSLEQSSILAPLTAGCGVPGAPCANLGPLARGGELSFGTNWLPLDNLELGLSYDLAWLHHDNAAAATVAGSGSPVSGSSLAGLGTASLPLGLSGYSLLDTQNSSVNALGRFRLDDSQSVNVGASLARIQLSVPGTAMPLTSLNQAAVSFGVQYGSFGGNLTGHVLSPTDAFGPNAVPGARMSGLDLGISWRTPWSGMFRFGTQNLWTSGNLPYLNNGPVTREIESSQARVPYVQYHQDL